MYGHLSLFFVCIYLSVFFVGVFFYDGWDAVSLRVGVEMDGDMC
jgi:hypothetical protein